MPVRHFSCGEFDCIDSTSDLWDVRLIDDDDEILSDNKQPALCTNTGPNKPTVFGRVFKFLEWIKQVSGLEPPIF